MDLLELKLELILLFKICYYLTCLALLATLVWFYIIHTHLNRFPTPAFIPILGHALDYIDSAKTAEIVSKKLIKCGGVMRQFIGPRKPSLFVGNRKFLEFLCSNSRFTEKSKFYDYLKPWLGEGLITSNGTKWKQRRKAISPLFTQTSTLKDFVEIFEEKGDLLMRILNKHNNKEVNIQPILKRLTFDIICETAMGVCLNHLEKQENTYANSIHVICEVLSNRMTNFFKSFDFFYQFSADCLREKQAVAVIDNFLDEIIRKKLEAKKNENETERRKDMLDLLMNVEIEGQCLSTSDLREEINTFTFAGYDTSSSTLSFALYQMAIYPDIQKKVLEEQKEIFKEDFKNPAVTYEKLHEMVYLDMVIQETLRYFTIVPMVGRRTTKDLYYDNTFIPAWTNNSIFIGAFHHNPKYFSQPDKFDPQRFAEKEKIDKLTYIPFGVKPRQCLGKNFAFLEIKSVLSKIIRNFEIIRIPDFEVKVTHKLIVHTSTGIWVEIRKRSKDVVKQAVVESLID